MTIEAKVIAHSRAAGAPDLITLQLRYPRFIHSEFMTHRVFSRNASSSRAIPVERMIQDVIDDPAMPVAWGSNKPGMQAGEECTNPVVLPDLEAWTRGEDYGSAYTAQEAWLEARDLAVRSARGFAAAGYHKQIVNRLLEPFAHISVVCTATNWQNFFDLRCHPDADPTMRALAEAMRDAIEESVPVEFTHGKDFWHLPYVETGDWHAVIDRLNTTGGTLKNDFSNTLAMISAARCARVSYLNHDGSNPDIEKDLALAKRLLESKHMSPFEHQAVRSPGTKSANFLGWRQYRQMIEALA
ncbi:FAD-dependent thymidylate synthase [Paracoccus yeei]|uniref:FAD-dependent thymidylate synthase n=1 Tax=Paracoccus yeei TaxID=147645 RepID=UPI00174C6722|nr:FAD-dependent thymidylate synthase [Paracoccus yeei]